VCVCVVLICVAFGGLVVVDIVAVVAAVVDAVVAATVAASADVCGAIKVYFCCFN